MPATSGTVGQTTFDVVTLIEHAFRRASGKITSLMSGDQLVSAKQNLSLVLAAFANKGLSLWCISTKGYAAVPYAAAYALDAGTEDVLTVMRRTGTFTSSGSTGAGVAALTYASATQVGSASLTLPSSAGLTVTWALQYSDDGVVWTTVGERSVAFSEETTICLLADPQPPALYWRVYQTAGASQTPVAVKFASAFYDTPLSKISRTDYFTLPNKNIAGTPTQFWYDKQAFSPNIVVWPVSSTEDYQFLVTVMTQVQDVTSYTESLMAPVRWYDAIIAELAVRVFLELPKEMRNDGISLNDLRDMAAEKLMEAGNSESDGGPIRWAPDISSYTRF